MMANCPDKLKDFCKKFNGVKDNRKFKRILLEYLDVIDENEHKLIKKLNQLSMVNFSENIQNEFDFYSYYFRCFLKDSNELTKLFSYSTSNEGKYLYTLYALKSVYFHTVAIAFCLFQ